MRWLRPALLGLMLLGASPLEAAQVASLQCNQWNCQIQIEGVIEANDRILITGKIDSDHLIYGKQILGSSGYLLDRPFSGRLFPRVYSLDSLTGTSDPRLDLVVKNLALKSKDPAIEARVIPPDYPWRKIYGSAFLVLLTLPFWMLFVFIALRSKKPLADGWHFPALESQWLVSLSLAILALEQPWAKVTVPILWSLESLDFLTQLSLPILLWCSTHLLLRSRFRDPSALNNRSRVRLPKFVELLNDGALLFSFSMLFFWPTPWLAMKAQSGLSLVLVAWTMMKFDFRKAWRRSHQGGLLLYFSLLLLVAEIAIRSLTPGDASGLPLLSPWFVLGCELFRRLRNDSIREQVHSLAKEVRRKLQPLESGQDRLLAFARLLEEEWGWARVTVLSVKEEEAIVLASEGTEAIDREQWFQPRRLGPLVRRVCKERRRIYAPVAEELNGELSDSGMKHSSLALPLSRKGTVRVVICLMAEDSQRIPPSEAYTLDLLTKNLSLEILSAVAQDEAELRASRFLSLAREKDGLSVEAMDQWGLSGLSTAGEWRHAIGATIGPRINDSSLENRMLHQRYQDIWTLWHSFTLAFEFIPLEEKSGFLAIAPRSFKDPQLMSLGPDLAAKLCLQQFTKAIQHWSLKPGNLLLPRLIWSTYNAPLTLRPRKSGLGIEVAEGDLVRFKKCLRERSRNFEGSSSDQGEISPSLPKRELRRLEQKAQELERMVRTSRKSVA